MRRRLLLVLLAFAVVAVAGFAVPLLLSTAESRTNEFILSRSADAARFAAMAQTALAENNTDQLRDEVAAHSRVFGDGVLIVDARRTVVVAEGLPADDPRAVSAAEAALRNQTQPRPADLRPWSSGDVLVSHAVGTGVRVSGAVVLRTSVEPAVADIRVSWAGILLGAIVALLAAAVLVLRITRWVLRPIDQLAAGMHRMTQGRGDTHVEVVSGPPELRGLADEFNEMSDALAESAERQRALVADVSHQLRNPMAALRLRLDGLADRQEDEHDVRQMQVELERLEDLLDGMMALASADSTATDLAAAETEAQCDAATVLAERVESWHDAASAAGVQLAGQPLPPLPVRCSDSELAQVLDVVLDNAIKYAGRGATVTWSSSPGDHVTLDIRDNGPGVAEKDLPRLTERFWRAGAAPGSGLGLAIAERLVTARGGTFELYRVRPHGLGVRMRLPAVPT